MRLEPASQLADRHIRLDPTRPADLLEQLHLRPLRHEPTVHDKQANQADPPQPGGATTGEHTQQSRQPLRFRHHAMNRWNWPTQPKDVDPETRLSLIANSTEDPATPAFLLEPVDHLPDLVLGTQHPQDHWNLPSPRSVYDQTFGSHHSTGLRPRYPRRQIPLSNLALLAQRPFDRLRGLDFLGVVDTGTLGLNPKLVHRSSPSGGRGLARLLSSCGVSRDDAMLDVGCGKGNALRTMQRQPFARVDGLELAPELGAVARTNFGRLGSRHTTIFQGDARTFDCYADYSYLYLYNPFPAEVMEPFLAAVEASLETKPRTLTVVYVNATCDVLSRSDTFDVIGQSVNRRGRSVELYRHHR
jgi:SAM-dependent methyltransferase